MPIVLIELQKRILIAPRRLRQPKTSNYFDPPNGKDDRNQIKVGKRRESCLPDGREWNDLPWISKILVSAAIAQHMKDFHPLHSKQHMEDMKNLTVF